MTEKIQINLRLKPEMIKTLKEEAEKQQRSVNNLIEVILSDYFKK